MSKFEGHTPGPWVYDKNLDVSQGGRFTSDQDDICFVNHEVGGRDGFANYDIAKANAALIATAPDLLAENEKLWEMCKELAATVKQFDMTYDYSPPCFNWRPKARCSNMAKKVLTRWEKMKKGVGENI
jgi:hypothetical protein